MIDRVGGPVGEALDLPSGCIRVTQALCFTGRKGWEVGTRGDRAGGQGCGESTEIRWGARQALPEKMALDLVFLHWVGRAGRIGGKDFQGILTAYAKTGRWNSYTGFGRLLGMPGWN